MEARDAKPFCNCWCVMCSGLGNSTHSWDSAIWERSKEKQCQFADLLKGAMPSHLGSGIVFGIGDLGRNGVFRYFGLLEGSSGEYKIS